MKKFLYSKWTEIRCNYMDDDNFWSVDAWQTSDDNEEGKVIAIIDDCTGRVYYIDPSARIDDYAQEIISEKREEIKDHVLEKKEMLESVYNFLVENEQYGDDWSDAKLVLDAINAVYTDITEWEPYRQ